MIRKSLSALHGYGLNRKPFWLDRTCLLLDYVADGRTTDYAYNTMGQLCGVEYPDGTFEQYSYNDEGLLKEARNANSRIKITRDRLGRVQEEWQDGHTVTSRYDKETALRVGVTSSLGANLQTGYTAAGMLQKMQVGNGDWEMSLGYNSRGQEIERVLSGGVVCSSEYDLVGRIHRQQVDAGGKRTRQMRYQWSQNDRLMGMVNELTHTGTWFDYDTMGNLVRSTHNETERLFRVPDAVGNLYRKPDRSDRKYSAGGRLLETEDTKYQYDEDGNMSSKVINGREAWQYKWNANGSLKEVIRPDHKTVAFEYDALGRRTAKTYDGKVTRWVWDGNTPLHEWTYDEKDRPKVVTDEFGLSHTEGTEPVDNITTWVFEEGSFRPAAKLTEDKKYSIITDYLGTPAQMYDEKGQLTWEARLDMYGKVANFAGSSLSDCPFRYQGQYEDEETGLYYNRFRYYDPDAGNYLSQDPIGLAGNNPTLYGYVKDVNSWVDVFGLSGRGGDVHQSIQDRLLGDLGRIHGAENVGIEGQITLSNGESRFGDVVAKDPVTGKVKEVHQIGDMRSCGGSRPSSRERGAIMDIRQSSDLAPNAKIVFHDKKGKVTLIDPDKSSDWKTPSDKHRKLKGGGCH